MSNDNPIVQLRKARGMSQQELASASGVGIRQVRGLETGEREIGNTTAQNLYALARALRVPMQTLLRDFSDDEDVQFGGSAISSCKLLSRANTGRAYIFEFGEARIFLKIFACVSTKLHLPFDGPEPPAPGWMYPKNKPDIPENYVETSPESACFIGYLMANGNLIERWGFSAGPQDEAYEGPYFAAYIDGRYRSVPVPQDVFLRLEADGNENVRLFDFNL